MTALETIDFTGANAVEVMAEGGPYFGKGSPTSGDHFDGDYLQGRAADTNAAIAAGELRSRLKLGHSAEQKLLRESGLIEDGLPAAGVFKNFRVVGEAPRRKVVADVLKVPRKLAAVVKAGSFPGRSVELRSLRSQTERGRVWRVIDAVGLLGEQAPAIRTLDDWLAYFGDAYQDADEVAIRSYAVDEVDLSDEVMRRFGLDDEASVVDAIDAEVERAHIAHEAAQRRAAADRAEQDREAEALMPLVEERFGL